MNAPVLGASGSLYAEKGSWETTVSWRYQKSFRHFVGSEEQVERAEDASQVMNRIHLLDVSVRYNLSERSSLTLGIPYVMATRSSPIRNQSRVVIDRSETQARGIGDILVSYRRELLNPRTSPDARLTLGVGLELPTGPSNVHDTRRTFSNGQIVSSVATVDQSIQPGDGGFGVLVELAGVRRFLDGKLSAFASGSYLVTPEETSGVLTYRNRPSEAEMSIADQYVASLGAAAGIPLLRGLSGSLGLRLEGVPSNDLVGGSSGFRRPGYAISLAPGLAYSWQKSSVSVNVPFALYRNRTVSTSDELDDAHGDAAFADWILLLAFSHQF